MKHIQKNKIVLSILLFVAIVLGVSSYIAQMHADFGETEWFSPVSTDDPGEDTIGVTFNDTSNDQFAYTRNDTSAVSVEVSAGGFGFGEFDVMMDIADDPISTDVFLGFGERQSGSGSYDIKIAKVTAVGGISWETLINPCGGFASFHCTNKILEMVPDGTGGVFVLLSSGDDLSFDSRVGLRRLDSSGTITLATTPSTGNYEGDMIPTGSGGVFVLTNLGVDQAFMSPDTHGEVRHYTTAGLDAGFGIAGVADVSSNTSSTKSTASMIQDGSGGLIVLWYDPEAGEEGIYGQHFSSSGVVDPTWTFRGKRIYASTSIDSINGSENNSFKIARSDSSFYVGFKEGGDLKVIDFDISGDRNWSCSAQDLGGGPDEFDLIGTVGSGTDQGAYVVWGDTSGADRGVFSQFFDETTGNSEWALGGVLVDDADGNGGSDFDVVLKETHYFTGEFAKLSRASGANSNGSGGVRVFYSYLVGVLQDVFSSSFDTTSFPAGPGGDCLGGGPVCGNSIIEPPETCDDGNTMSGDGCSSSCLIEAAGAVDPRITHGGGGRTPVFIPRPAATLVVEEPEELCGNEIIDDGEACDDGNKIDGDGCSAACIIENLAPPIDLIIHNSIQPARDNGLILDFEVQGISSGIFSVKKDDPETKSHRSLEVFGDKSFVINVPTRIEIPKNRIYELLSFNYSKKFYELSQNARVDFSLYNDLFTKAEEEGSVPLVLVAEGEDGEVTKEFTLIMDNFPPKLTVDTPVGNYKKPILVNISAD